jgi:hypothetical protein
VPESLALDFKAEHMTNTAEHAKDMAAFANVLGGTILVVSLSAFLRDRSEIVRVLVPLEDVEAVWRSVGGWSVRLNGALVFRRNAEGRRTYQIHVGPRPVQLGLVRSRTPPLARLGDSFKQRASITGASAPICPSKSRKEDAP